MQRFVRSIVHSLARKVAIRIGKLLQQVDGIIADQTLPDFPNNPKKLRIDLPRRIMNPERIYFGNNVFIGPGGLLFAMSHYPTVSMQPPDKKLPVQHFDSKIIIGNNVTATEGLQIAACSEVSIGDDVMFASNVHINDGMHGYERADEPYKYQKMFRIAPIKIKRGCWIGQNVVILPGVEIGEFTIIGANSVVTRSLPKQSIAVGAPAKVVKKWDKQSQEWIPVESD